MLIKYDKDIDAKYIILQPEKQARGVVVRTKQLEEWLLIDFDKEDKVFAVEILDASEHPISLSVIDGKEVRYSLELDSDESLEGDSILVAGEVALK